MHTYDAVTTRAGRYVQGGGCGTVGVADLVQGGGFGSYSKQFGTAGASLLEAEIVTADGAVRVANACREPELFSALKGGGGGNFGVVTRLTLRTWDLPAMFGTIETTIQARSDAAFRRLLGSFVAFYAEQLFNRHRGEQAKLLSGNRCRSE
jgi:FAD/FMN-containing dehydrogenase